MVRLLTEVRAALDRADFSQSTALMCACQEGYLETVRLLIQAGAKTDLADTEGTTALLLACHDGHLEVARLLLEARAQTDPRNDRGITPLMIAAKDGRCCHCRLLLEAGADTGLLDSSGKTALQEATLEGHHDVIQLLRAKRPRSELSLVTKLPNMRAKLCASSSLGWLFALVVFIMLGFVGCHVAIALLSGYSRASRQR